MKKTIIILLIFLLMSGCSLKNIDNTPTKQVETFFNNYQTLDKKVLDDLDIVIAKQTNFTDKQKEEYRNILKKHYQDLTYEIKDETINGNRANVEVEIEVTDFYKVLNESNEYLKNNSNEFYDQQNNYDESKFINYQLDKLKDANETVKYTLNLTLVKNDDGDWILDDIDDIQEKKILGIYEY